MSFDALDRREVAWCLVVAGLPYRYYSRVAPGSAVVDGRLFDHALALVQTPTDVDAVLEVGPLDMQLDDVGGIAAQEPVEVRILARGARTAAGARIDPYLTIMRTAGHPAADLAVKLAATLEHAPDGDGPVDIEVTADVSAWTLPGPIHIGQEVIWADSSAAGPYRFTGCTRGADLWATQEHTVSARDHEQPWIASDVCTWHGRRAAIYVGAIVGGAVPTWEQYWAGLIDSAPELKGDVITVRVAPFTRVMQYRLGVGSAARSAVAVPGGHRIVPGDDGAADTLDLIIRWDMRSIELHVSAANVATGVLMLTAESAALLDTIGRPLDLSCVSIVRSPAGGVGGPETATAWASPNLTFPAAGSVATNAAAGIGGGYAVDLHIESGEFFDTMPLQLVDPAGGTTEIEIPGAIETVVNDTSAWQDEIASWADPSDGGRDTRYGVLQLRQDVAWRLIGWIAAPASQQGVMTAGYGHVKAIRGGRRMCWAGLIIGEGVEAVRGARLTDERRAVRSNLSLDPAIEGFQSTGQAGAEWPCDLPVWYYQSGEAWIGPFDVDIRTAAAGVPQAIRIVGTGTDVIVWVTDSDSAAHPVTGDNVYWYEVREDMRDRTRTVVMRDGEAPLVAQVVASADDTMPGEYIRRLLESGVGNGDNGTGDLLPIGANLHTDVVVDEAFMRMPAPTALRRQDYLAVRGETIADQTEGLLMACGVQVAQVYSAALDRWQVSLVHLGPADALSSVLTVTEEDMEVGRDGAYVETVTDGRVVKSYRILWNHDEAGQPTVTEVEASRERADGGADSGEPVELDLPGVRVSPDAGSLAQAAAEVVADMRSRVGLPRVRWRFTIRADMPGAVAVALGSTVTVTSADAIMIRPGDTAAGIPCRVVGLVRDVEANRLALEVRPYPALAAGWAPALLVTVVNSPTSVDVNASAYSDDDVSFFAAGDAVACVPSGDWASRVQTTIDTIAGVTIDTLAAHGLAVGDTIRLDNYDAATGARSEVGGHAFLADAGGELGAGGDPGKVIA